MSSIGKKQSCEMPTSRAIVSIGWQAEGIARVWDVEPTSILVLSTAVDPKYRHKSKSPTTPIESNEQTQNQNINIPIISIIGGCIQHLANQLIELYLIIINAMKLITASTLLSFSYSQQPPKLTIIMVLKVSRSLPKDTNVRQT